MILPETHVGELLPEVLPDLMQVVRAPDHADAAGLFARARATVFASWEDRLAERTPLEKAWHDGAAEVQLDTLLSVAHLLVAHGFEFP